MPSPSSAPASTSSGSDGKASSTSESAGKTSKRQDGSADTDAPDSGDARTPEEKRAGVDGKLDASLGTFDDQLRREQQRTAQERDSRAAGRPEGAAVDEAQHAGKEQGGRDRSGDLRSDSGQSGDAKSDGTEKGGEQKTGAAMPQGGGGASASNAIPSGVDDDIIARRLRKAAEAETDPELKEKLWKEYRDYKENTRGGG
jgi:hypothetical protein